MNIFALSRNPYKSAEEMIDKHVIKMPTESCQMLHTNVLFADYVKHYGEEPSLAELKQFHRDIGSNLMIPAMLNHPSTVWARQTDDNARWLYEHAKALCDEYTKRYGKEHGSEARIYDISHEIHVHSDWKNASAVTIAMDDKYRLDYNNDIDMWDFVNKQYQHYYLEGKWKFASWKTEVPKWWPKNHIKKKWNIEFEAMERATGLKMNKYKIEE